MNNLFRRGKTLFARFRPSKATSKDTAPVAAPAFLVETPSPAYREDWEKRLAAARSAQPEATEEVCRKKVVNDLVEKFLDDSIPLIGETFVILAAKKYADHVPEAQEALWKISEHILLKFEAAFLKLPPTYSPSEETNMRNMLAYVSVSLKPGSPEEERAVTLWAKLEDRFYGCIPQFALGSALQVAQSAPGGSLLQWRAAERASQYIKVAGL